MNHVEDNFQFVVFICALELVRLVDRHLRILVSVKEQQGRIVRVDVKHRARKFRKRRHSVGLCAQQPFESGRAHIHTEWSGLLQDRRQIRRAVITEDRLH